MAAVDYDDGYERGNENGRGMGRLLERRRALRLINKERDLHKQLEREWKGEGNNFISLQHRAIAQVLEDLAGRFASKKPRARRENRK